MNSKVRVGHFSPDAPGVDIAVDGVIAFENAEFREVTGWADLAAGAHEVSIMAHGGTEAVLEQEVNLDEDTYYTVLATGLMADDDLELEIIADYMQ